MRLQRFYIGQKIGDEKEITVSDAELAHQLSKVFRFTAGDQVILFDGSGSEYTAEIVSLSKNEAVMKILAEKALATDVNQKATVSLYLALIKKGNFELAAEKCTEIGVSEIHPIISERSEKKDLNIERLEKIVKEASEQSGRTTLPKVLSVTDLDIAVSQAVQAGRVCVAFHTDADSSTPSKIIQTNSLHLTKTNHSESCLNNFEGEVAVFVGPEGGWTEKEMAIFKKNNFKILSLGQNVLRAETAAMVAVWESLK